MLALGNRASTQVLCVLLVKCCAHGCVSLRLVVASVCGLSCRAFFIVCMSLLSGVLNQ